MGIGSFIRSKFGSRERQVADLYRSIFIDLQDYKKSLRELKIQPQNILEIGAGEDAVTEILADVFPCARILGIDIIPHVGRLYEGRTEAVEFRKQSVQQLVADATEEFDLIILSDVLHHIPEHLRPEIITIIQQLLAPKGMLLFKDWARNRTPIYFLSYASDRWLTGDRIAYLTPAEAQRLIKQKAPQLRLKSADTIKPCSNNYYLVFVK